MSRRDGFNGPNNNGLASNGRPLDQRPDAHADYRLDQRRYMDSFPGGQAFYPAAPDLRNFPQVATSSAGSKQTPYPQPSPPSRPQVNQPGPYRKWGSPQQLPPLSQGPGRNPLNLNSTHGHPNTQSQNQLPKQIQNHQARRQGPGPRPQVRLPNIHQSHQPVNGPHREVSPTESGSNLKSRTSFLPSESKDVQPKNAIRRHRPSISNSSRTSFGSTSWDPTLPSTESSSPDRPLDDESPQKSPTTPTRTAEDLDKAWLLLRQESEKRLPPTETDQYAHIPPLIRKWAGVTVPEVRMGEPRWATSVLSRKWEKEEAWEKEKKELHAQKEQLGDDAPMPFRPITCMTKEQELANRIAELTLAMLRDMNDKDVILKNISKHEITSVEDK